MIQFGGMCSTNVCKRFKKGRLSSGDAGGA